MKLFLIAKSLYPETSELLLLHSAVLLATKAVELEKNVPFFEDMKIFAQKTKLFTDSEINTLVSEDQKEIEKNMLRHLGWNPI